MITATNNGGGNFEPVPAGTFAARCFEMIQIGTIKEVIQGKEKMLNKVRVSWELPTEAKVFKEGDPAKPQVISKEFTLSMNEKATLRKFLAAWRGKDFTEDESKAFDITVLLGKSCLLSIIHKTSSSGSTYADIASVSMVPKGMTVPDQINDTSVLSYDNWDWDKFNSLPDFIKNKITSSVEYRTINAPETAHLDNGSNQDIPDDLPF
jgi:hypothetical protein